LVLFDGDDFGLERDVAPGEEEGSFVGLEEEEGRGVEGGREGGRDQICVVKEWSAFFSF